MEIVSFCDFLPSESLDVSGVDFSVADVSVLESCDLSTAPSVLLAAETLESLLFADFFSVAVDLALEEAFDFDALASLLFLLTWLVPLVVNFESRGYTISAPIVLQIN